jgi:hypothetical protein
MEALQTAKWRRVVSNGINTKDTARVLKTERDNPSPEMLWRGALFEMARDSIYFIHDETEESDQSIWEEEAQARGAGFVQLALTGLFEAISPNQGGGNCRLDVQSISTLARCYRSLQETNPSGRLECEHILRDTLFGLGAAYQPAVRNLELQVSSCPVVLCLTQRRALILFMSCVVQGILGRASRYRSHGQVSLTLTTISPSAGSLRIQTCDRAMELFFSPEYTVATRLAGILGADLVSRQEPSGGSILEMRFPLPYALPAVLTTHKHLPSSLRTARVGGRPFAMRQIRNGSTSDGPLSEG